jgi:hypothetical protein
MNANTHPSPHIQRKENDVSIDQILFARPSDRRIATDKAAGPSCQFDAPDYSEGRKTRTAAWDPGEPAGAAT